MSMARLALVCVLAATVAASESDGGHAAPERWTHPGGPAAGNYRTQAVAPDDYGGVLWTYKAKAKVLAPPLTWDGAVFVIDGTSASASLVALDAASGKVLAKTKVKNVGTPRPAVHARSVFLLENGNNLVQYRLRGRKFERRWEYKVGDGASAARILGGEIYVTTPRGLLRLRAGMPQPVWTAAGDWAGEPAIYKGHVYGLVRSGGQLALTAVARADGKVAASLGFDAADGARVAVAETMIAAKLLGQSWALFKRSAKKDSLTLSFERREELVVDPLVGSSIMIGLKAKPRAWHFIRFNKKMPTNVIGRGRTDLVEGTASPISLNGPTICFGPWCSDVNDNSILWRLGSTKEFAAGVRYNAVPTTHRHILLVTKDGSSLHLIGPEEIG